MTEQHLRCRYFILRDGWQYLDDRHPVVHVEGVVAEAGEGIGHLLRQGVPPGAEWAGYPKMRLAGNGHHRTCTLPMMYFFGTRPQWRLSELLLRWSPSTK